MRMKPHFLVLFLLLVIMHLASPGGMVFAQPDEIVRDSDMMPLFPDLEAGKGDGEKKKSGRTEWETVDIKLFRVTLVSGNNPFHTREPVRNFDGETFPTISDVKRRARGQTTAYVGGGCNPSTATARVTARNASQGIYYTMDTATGSCKVTVDTFFPNSAFWIGQLPAAGHPHQLWLMANHPALFRITQFPPGCGGGTSCNITPGTYDLVLLEVTTGRQWRINISFTGNGVDPYSFFNYGSFTVTINSVTPLN